MIGATAAGDSAAQSAADASRLAVERMLNAPESWRARAIALAGLVGAFAAATAGAVLLTSSPLQSWPLGLAVVGSLLYVIAFLFFVSAAVASTKAPPSEHEDARKLLASLSDKSANDVEIIRGRTLRGAWAGLVAVTLSLAAIVGLGLYRDVRSGTISLDPSTKARLQILCQHTTPDRFIGTVEGSKGEDDVTLTIPEKACKDNVVRLRISRSLVLVVEG